MFEEVFVFSIKCLLWKYKSLNSRFYHKSLACWDWLSSVIIIWVFDYQTYHSSFQRLYFILRELESNPSRRLCNKSFWTKLHALFSAKRKSWNFRRIFVQNFSIHSFEIVKSKLFKREKTGSFYNCSVYVVYYSCNKSVMRKSYHCSNKSNYDEDRSGEDWYYMMASEAKEKLD